MVPAELIEGNGTVGAKIQEASREIEVTFSTAGPPAGHIRIRNATQTVDTDLATQVLDNYDAWRDDPRYKRWTTDPYLKAALTPTTGHP
jgi:hypothetical protein